MYTSAMDALENILANICTAHPLVREVGGIAGNVHVDFVTSVEAVHSWKRQITNRRANYPYYGLADLIEAQRAEIERLRHLYHELIYAVASKYPNETRHETALRYIRTAESRYNGPEQISGV